MKNFGITLAIALILCACSYSLFVNTYPYLKTIRIESFQNRSTQYAIEQDLDTSLHSDFQKGNLLDLVQKDPDCLLEGEILDYTNRIFSYDTNQQVKEYEVKILFQVKVTDLVKNTVIWEKDQLILSKTYLNPNLTSDQNTTEPQSEADARTEIYHDLYDTIIKSTFQAW
jgi:hypothetical protein